MKLILVIFISLASMSANADWSLIAGAGQGDFKWCGDDGCWHQNPLPYWDDRSGSTSVLGVRYNINKNLAIDGLYHAFPTVRAGGTYVADDSYNPITHEISATWTYQTNMITRTYGGSLSLVPKLYFGDVSVFGRVGGLMYYQTTDFTHEGETTPYFRESGNNVTWIVGLGTGYTIGRFTIAAEAQAFPRVKEGQSPVGGDFKNDKLFGLVTYLITIEYRL